MTHPSQESLKAHSFRIKKQTFVVFYRVKILVKFLCCAAISSSLYAAENSEVFVVIPPSQVGDQNPSQARRVSQIKSRDTTNSVTLVRPNIEALIQGGPRISLPNSATVMKFGNGKIDLKAPDDSKNFTWSGVAPNLGGVEGRAGQATLIVHDGNVTGTIRENGDLYRVEPVGNGVHALIKVKQSAFPPEHPPSFHDLEKKKEEGNIPLNGKDKNGSLNGTSPFDVVADSTLVDIDVLVAYTPSARGEVGDIGSTIKLAVEETNQSYRNSTVKIRMNLVDKFEVTYNESDKTHEVILDELSGMHDVKNRRDTVKADLVVFIINQKSYCGLAKAIMAVPSDAFAVVHWDCATGYYSFAHEIGHLQGARHDPDNDSATTPYPYGHGYQHNSPLPAWRTIMAYDCGSGCPRLPFWANPDVVYQGQPMGTRDTSNDSKVLNQTASLVSRFR